MWIVQRGFDEFDPPTANLCSTLDYLGTRHQSQWQGPPQAPRHAGAEWRQCDIEKSMGVLLI